MILRSPEGYTWRQIKLTFENDEVQWGKKNPQNSESSEKKTESWW